GRCVWKRTALQWVVRRQEAVEHNHEVEGRDAEHADHGQLVTPELPPHQLPLAGDHLRVFVVRGFVLDLRAKWAGEPSCQCTHGYARIILMRGYNHSSTMSEIKVPLMVRTVRISRIPA